MVWDSENMSAPHTIREIEQIEQPENPDDVEIANAYDDGLRMGARIARAEADTWEAKGPMADGARMACKVIEQVILANIGGK